VIEDYGVCANITHDFDRQVIPEGISSALAVPVVVGTRSRAVLYAAVRGSEPLGSRALDLVMRSARRISERIRVQDQVELRLRHLVPAETGASARSWTQQDRTALRDVYAELRALAATIDDRSTQDKLRAVCDRIVGIACSAPPTPVAPILSRREIDVLSQVALGLTNAEIADQLGVLPETVKAYLRSASGKLNTHSRLEAVVAARRLGLLL
jgi:DNA-binding CsgD family transcriptional regulator